MFHPKPITTRELLFVERIIAAFFLVCGCLGMYFGIISLSNFIGVIRRALETGPLTWESISLFKIIKGFHWFFLLSLASIFAGSFTLMGRRIGWVVSLIVSLLAGTLFWIPIDRIHHIDNWVRYVLAMSANSLLFLTIFFVLQVKPFRAKYAPTSKTWWLITIFVLISLLEKTILFLLS